MTLIENANIKSFCHSLACLQGKPVHCQCTFIVMDSVSKIHSWPERKKHTNAKIAESATYRE